MSPGIIVTEAGDQVGTVPATELVTVGQRKGLNVSGMSEPHFVTDVNLQESVVTIGPRRSLRVEETTFIQPVWATEPFTGEARVQASAQGTALLAEVHADRVTWAEPRDRIAAGESLVFYEGDGNDATVIGGAIAT